MIPAQALQNLIDEGDRLIGTRHTETCGSRHTDDCDCHVMKWHGVKTDLRRSFEEEAKALPEVLSRALEIKGDRILDPHLPAAQIKWSTNGKVEEATKEILHRMRVPVIMRQEDLSAVVEHIIQWNMQSALLRASKTIGFPHEALMILTDLSVQFGDCGIHSGAAFEPMRKGIALLMSKLGYEFNQEKRVFLKTTTA